MGRIGYYDEDAEEIRYLDEEDDDFDEEEWDLMMCSMGRDGQCGQAGSEFCDFDCPVMESLRRKNSSKR